MSREEQAQNETYQEPDLDKCLIPLLKALNWHGKKRHLKEAMPHISSIYTPPMFRDVLENLNYDCSILEADLNRIDSRLYPLLFISKKMGPLVLLNKTDEYIEAFCAKRNAVLKFSLTDDITRSSGVGYIFTVNKDTSASKKLRESWITQTFKKNKALFWSALFFSFAVNFLMLSTPLYVMSVYDRVVSTGSYQMLGEFVAGIIIAILGIILLYRIRAKVIAIFGARLDRAIGSNIFERLLYLSPSLTESATVGAQVARIKDFDRLRQFLAGPLLTTFFDVPYLVIALVIIGLIAGMLVVIPVVMIILFIIFGGTLHLKVQRAIRVSSFYGTRQQEFVLESINNLKSIKYLAAEKESIDRYRTMSAETNYSTLRVSLLGAINGALSDALMIATGMAVLVFGAIMIINQTLTVGGMIATMILIWRVLAPLKTLFNTLPRLQQMSTSLRQINNLMKLEPEAQAIELLTRSSRTFNGDIAFSRVSFRYQKAMDPALMGIEFAINKGEIVGIIGKNGSGKSTILKMLLGLYFPQAGSILIDNQDIRQINPIELRNAIAYVPQKPELFYGSIESNLRLGKPDATADELILATKASGIYDEIMAMPGKFDESLRDFSTSKLSASFQQGLCLARAYLKRSSILLLDEPAGILDRNLDAYFTRVIEQCRGKVTVLMVSHRPSHLKICDKILLIDKGQMLLYGPPNEVLPQIPKGFL